MSSGWETRHVPPKRVKPVRRSGGALRNAALRYAEAAGKWPPQQLPSQLPLQPAAPAEVAAGPGETKPAAAAAAAEDVVKARAEQKRAQLRLRQGPFYRPEIPQESRTVWEEAKAQGRRSFWPRVGIVVFGMGFVASSGDFWKTDWATLEMRKRG